VRASLAASSQPPERTAPRRLRRPGRHAIVEGPQAGITGAGAGTGEAAVWCGAYRSKRSPGGSRWDNRQRRRWPASSRSRSRQRARARGREPASALISKHSRCLEAVPDPKRSSTSLGPDARVALPDSRGCDHHDQPGGGDRSHRHPSQQLPLAAALRSAPSRGGRPPCQRGASCCGRRSAPAGGVTQSSVSRGRVIGLGWEPTRDSRWEQSWVPVERVDACSRR
jgi:hypothetical protein